MDFIVRDAYPHDAFAVSELAARTFPLACPPTLAQAHIDAYIREHLTPEHFAAHIDHPEHDVLVATVGRALVGYALLLLGPDGAPAPNLGVTLQRAGLLSKCYAVPEVHAKESRRQSSKPPNNALVNAVWRVYGSTRMLITTGRSVSTASTGGSAWAISISWWVR